MNDASEVVATMESVTTAQHGISRQVSIHAANVNISI